MGSPTKRTPRPRLGARRGHRTGADVESPDGGEVPPKGARGTRFPRFVSGLFRGFMVRQFRRRGMLTQGGVQTLMLEPVGAKSRATRHAVLGYLEEPPSSWLVIASLAGSSHNPKWLHNLAKRSEAIAEFEGGRRIEVHAESLQGDDLAAAWDRIGREAAAPLTEWRPAQAIRRRHQVSSRRRTHPADAGSPGRRSGSARASRHRSPAARSLLPR